MLPSSALSAIAVPPFTEELITTSSATATVTTSPTPTESPQMCMVPVFPDQFVTPCSPPKPITTTAKSIESETKKTTQIKTGYESKPSDFGASLSGNAAKVS